MKEVQQAEALRLADALENGDCFDVGISGVAYGWKKNDPTSEAAEELRSQHARIAELEAELEAVGAGGVQRLAAVPQPCSRSHPHEEMTPMCELRTEIARLTNALARAEAAAQQGVQPKGEWTREVVQGSVVIRHPYGDSYEFPISTLAGYFAHPTQQGLDALHKQMLSALESVGSHTITDCDGDDVEVYFCNWEMVSAAKRAALAAQSKQGGA